MRWLSTAEMNTPKLSLKISKLILDLLMFFWQISQIKAEKNDESREKP